MTTDPPPAFEPSTIDLQSVTDSKVVSVSLYSTRAEVTRLSKFAVKPGLNQVNISGLPSALQIESLRVEGRGAATIHDVTVSKIANALAQCQKALASLAQYLGSLSVQHLEVSKLENVLESYEASGERLNAKKSEFTQELRIVETTIVVERAQITAPHENDRLRMKAAIGLFAQAAGDLEIALIYAVPAATWTAFYDIRVDMDTKENPVTLIYKTAVRPQSMPMGRLLMGAAPGSASMASSDDMIGASTVSATFRVPGLVNIPSDGETHNFTIVELELKAAMSWVSVPKIDAKTHLTVRTPEYTLLSGKASVYVDGSFISRSDVPAVSPQESFDCPLGLDSSIRITYHPLIKKLTHSGFYTKNANYVFSQRITNAQIEVRLVAPALALAADAGARSINLKAPPKSAEAQMVNVGPG
ncbi:hypothetical protein DFH09DRAFT_1446849 [Mycena vulgaris]|nr:hypothetical protein DFH09DRAFT_1446849 [Mycena vulgaris]